ncbi:MAG: hypothetical protein AMJ68_06720 [Acidithiobacillales bacterium SG8_45]|jgi:hypothetical protein|nr:MAG: hypothetical protein AMJ68_06720 [Acidithiobacillales bacterium SG8_45]
MKVNRFLYLFYLPVNWQANMAGNPNTLRILTQAIQEKRCVAIRCDGKNRLVTIEPHVIYTDEHSNIVVGCFQKSSADKDDGAEGFWNAINWRKINAVFWLNTFFTPRIDQGFVEADVKYQAGLVAMVNTGNRLKSDRLTFQSIESSLEQLLASSQGTAIKH